MRGELAFRVMRGPQEPKLPERDSLPQLVLLVLVMMNE